MLNRIDDSEAYGLAVALVRERRNCSVALVQRNLLVGYNQALRLVERMEQEGVMVRMSSGEASCWRIVGSDGTLLPQPNEPQETLLE